MMTYEEKVFLSQLLSKYMDDIQQKYSCREKGFNQGFKAQYEHARIIHRKLTFEINKEMNGV